jgi:thymidylate synthase
LDSSAIPGYHRIEWWRYVDGIRLQLEREPMAPPRLLLSDKPVLAQTFGDIAIEGYRHHPAIKFQVAI